jgi:N-acetyl sugar amidotransferase
MIKLCNKGIWDETIPSIKFNTEGTSNYCSFQEKMMRDYPRGSVGEKEWEKIVLQISVHGKGKKYDCIIGVSGGVDSSYLLHMANKCGLKPLAVHLDNGFNSEIAVNNIEKITKALNIDLVTHVINYEEIKDLLTSYLKAGMPWIDFPTDLAIKATMYNVALKYNIKFILRGNDFRSEGKQPTEWTYSDTKQLLFIHKKFGKKIPLKTYPVLPLSKQLYVGTVKKIKDIRPYYYLDYNKEKAKQLLIDTYNWKDYGGHHHENLFTKFAMAYWLPRKFGIDKRRINLSAQVLSGAITRDEALKKISEPFDTPEELEKLMQFVIKKLDLTIDEFEKIMKSPNKTFKDYPSDYNLIYKNIKHFKWFIKRLYAFKPMSIESKELIDN